MQRRTFMVGAGAVLGGAAVLRSDDEAAVKQAIRNLYQAYAGTDVARYRSLLTTDYRLLENGTLLTASDDVQAMTSRPPGYRRVDAFDFQLVRVLDDAAYAVYFLKSEIVDAKEGSREKEWLESAVLRRVGPAWRMAVLSSTPRRIGAK